MRATHACWLGLGGVEGQKWVLIIDVVTQVEPRLLPELMACGSLVSVNSHTPLNQFSWTNRYVVWNLKVSYLNFTVKILVILTFKWKLTTEKGEEKNSSCVDISGRTTIVCLLHNLWRHVGGSTAEYLDLLIVWNASAEAKVYQFNLILVSKHHIFELDVSMSDAFAVKVAQCADQLAPDGSRFVLWHAAIWLRLKETVRWSTVDVLENKYYLSLGLNCLVELSNIWVIDPLHQPDLSPDRLLSGNILDFLLFVNL